MLVTCRARNRFTFITIRIVIARYHANTRASNFSRTRDRAMQFTINATFLAAAQSPCAYSQPIIFIIVMCASLSPYLLLFLLCEIREAVQSIISFSRTPKLHFWYNFVIKSFPLFVLCTFFLALSFHRIACWKVDDKETIQGRIKIF